MLRNRFHYLPALPAHDSPDKARHATTTRSARPHEIPEHTAEAVSRLLTRVVPLVYGTLLGLTGGSLHVGVLIGALGSLAFDLSMDGHSLARPVARRLVGATRRAAAAAWPRIDAFTTRLGL